MTRPTRLFLALGSALLAGSFLVAATARAADDDKAIKKIWKGKCASCHGADGKADTDQGKEQAVASMADEAWQKKFTDQQLKDATLNGVKRDKDGKKQEMKAYKDKLKPEEIDGLVKMMRSFKK